MKLMDDYPERVVVGFAFWPFVSLLNFTLVRRRAVPSNLRHHFHHLRHLHPHHGKPSPPRRHRLPRRWPTIRPTTTRTKTIKP